MSAASSIPSSSLQLQTSATWGAQTDLDRVALNTNLTENQKIGELAKEFEAMLFKQVLKGMKESFGGSSMFPSSGPHSIYGDMMIDTLAQSVSHAGQIGFAKTFTNQMTHPPVTDATATGDEKTSTIEAKEDK
jgi:Rod binding domain-containing protein